MVLLDTSEEWQRQSSLLLKARPTTARTTMKYKLPNLESPKYQKPKKRKREAETDQKEATPTAKVPRAQLVLRTYDPESGVCLHFKTDRAAEVGRLIGGLGRLGRHMAALPPKTEDTTIPDAPAHEESAAPDQMVVSNATVSDSKTQQSTGGGGAKKKKKGKK